VATAAMASVAADLPRPQEEVRPELGLRRGVLGCRNGARRSRRRRAAGARVRPWRRVLGSRQRHPLPRGGSRRWQLLDCRWLKHGLRGRLRPGRHGSGRPRHSRAGQRPDASGACIRCGGRRRDGSRLRDCELRRLGLVERRWGRRRLPERCRRASPGPGMQFYDARHAGKPIRQQQAPARGSQGRRVPAPSDMEQSRPRQAGRQNSNAAQLEHAPLLNAIQRQGADARDPVRATHPPPARRAYGQFVARRGAWAWAPLSGGPRPLPRRCRRLRRKQA
jgi:hypothetical protein